MSANANHDMKIHAMRWKSILILHEASFYNSSNYILSYNLLKLIFIIIEVRKVRVQEKVV